MFLEFAARGAWFVVIAGHMHELGFSGRQIAAVYATSSIGALISPLIAGWIADRFLSAQYLASFCQLLGGLSLMAAWTQTAFIPFWLAILAQSIVFAPTVALVTAICFKHIRSPHAFGYIRVWGTVGWMVTNWMLSAYFLFYETHLPGISRVGDGLLFGGIAAVVLSLYSLTLPPTPPSRGERYPYDFLGAFRLMRDRNFVLIFFISVAAGMVIPFLYNLTFLFFTDSLTGLSLTSSKAAFSITIAQFAEIVMMLLLMPVIRRIGMRWTLFLGLMALCTRLTIFAMGGPLALVIIAQALHGVDYALFFTTSLIAVEHISRHDEIRARAQSLMTFATYGVGMLIGHFLSGWVYDASARPDGGHDWVAIFSWPLLIIVPATIALHVLFNDARFRDAGYHEPVRVVTDV